MQQVGKYQLIRKLATGGMAEVYLAKAAGPMGFEKTLVLKRILPHLAEEPAFVEMFLSEAKLAAQLTHPNIVQIFDFGEADGTYFLAMEYIDGPSLRTLIKRASAQGMSLPLTACARLVAHACEGLAFAHDFAEPETEEPLGLVHRDISPDNILLSKQGAVKVVDFGIAKAAGQGHRTASGVIKGKLAYMPPEQVRAEPLDRRADVYALGVVLYELLTAHKPFEAQSDVGLMRAILTQSPMPAVQFRPELPDSLRRILGRALSKDREQRYPDCHALQSDLEEFILSVGKPLTTQQLAQLIAQVASSADRSTPTPQPATPPSGPTPSVSPVHTQPTPDAKTDVQPSPRPETVQLRRPEPKQEEAPEPSTERTTLPHDVRPLPRATPPSGQVATRPQRTPVKPQRGGRGVLVALVAGVLIAAGGGVVLSRRSSSGTEPREPMDVAEHEPLPAPTPSAEPPTSTNAPGALPREQTNAGALSVPQDPLTSSAGSPAAPTTPEEPVTPKPAPPEPDTSRTEPSSHGGLSVRPKSAPKVPPKVVALKGKLEIRVRPFATVYLNGKLLGDTPFDDPIELPPGDYTVKLVNKGVKIDDKLVPKTVTKSVEVKPGQSTVLPVNLYQE
ncbi:protein kinase domain-containing protein [Archangium sp.]|uniref:serine/threonine protein kinase n=1 Tax=Archangium sp. TaxID=1872627 RepID=UPI00286D6080|nr:protein kinase [Archangium sp.]